MKARLITVCALACIIVGQAIASQKCAVFGAPINEARNHELVSKASSLYLRLQSDTDIPKERLPEVDVESYDELFATDEFLKVEASNELIVYIDKDVDRVSKALSNRAILLLVAKHLNSEGTIEFNDLNETEKKDLLAFVNQKLPGGQGAGVGDAKIGIGLQTTFSFQVPNHGSMKVEGAGETFRNMLDDLRESPVKQEEEKPIQPQSPESNRMHTDIFLVGGSDSWEEASKVFAETCKAMESEASMLHNDLFMKFQASLHDVSANLIGTQGASYDQLSDYMKVVVKDHLASRYQELGFESREDARAYAETLTFDVGSSLSLGIVVQGENGAQTGMFSVISRLGPQNKD